MRMKQSALAAARPLIGKVDAWCTPRLGAESPSFGLLIKTMDDGDHVLAECLAMHPNSTPAGEQYATAGEPEETAVPPATPGVPQSREDAYRQLASIAQYLLRYEPHSPVPYMIQRALEWGSKPLPELIQELMASDAGGPKLWSMLGLLPGDGGKGK
jgi:type VI secretion system protein ImpA